MKRLILAFSVLVFLTISAFAQSTNFGMSPIGSTQTMSVTNASSSITLNSSPGNTVLIQNTGANTAFVKCASSAATTDFPIQAGWGIALNCPPGNSFSAITASSTTSLYVTKGLGNTALTGGGGGGGGGGGNVTIVGPLGQALAGASIPVVLTAAQLATLTPPTSVNVGNFPATQPVSSSTLGTAANQATIITALTTLNTTAGNPLATQGPTVSIGGVGIIDSGGTNKVNVLAASTAPAATNLSLSVALNPNNTANSVPYNVAIPAIATGGASTSGAIAPATPSAVAIKGSAGTIYGTELFNVSSSAAWLKIYDSASATCGSGTPIKRILIPANATAANGSGTVISFGSVGIVTSTGISYCITGLLADADTTAITASSIAANFNYK